MSTLVFRDKEHSFSLLSRVAIVFFVDIVKLRMFLFILNLLRILVRLVFIRFFSQSFDIISSLFMFFKS